VHCCHVGEYRKGDRRIAREVCWKFMIVGSVLWAGGMRKMVSSKMASSMLENQLVTF
jgi:hypothetical protein